MLLNLKYLRSIEEPRLSVIVVQGTWLFQITSQNFYSGQTAVISTSSNLLLEGSCFPKAVSRRSEGNFNSQKPKILISSLY